MSLLLRILGGLALIGIGLVFVIKTDWFINNIGRIEWAEIKLGSGGTWLFYKLIGILLCFIGLLVMTGLSGGFLMGTVGRLFLPPQ